MSKICTSCKKEKDISDFSVCNSTKDGLRPQCKKCCHEGYIRWKTKNPEKARQKWRNGSKLYYSKSGFYDKRKLKRYGLTTEKYEQFVLEQDGKCKICFSNETVLCIDHCHKSGKIRGLLCSNCNTTLGLMNDDPERLKRAADYLITNQ